MKQTINNRNQCETGETAKPEKSFYFQDSADMKIEVRAFRIVNGKKEYSKENSSILPDAEIMRMWEEALGES